MKKNNKKIGIITMYYKSQNYGGLLQRLKITVLLDISFELAEF